MKKFLVIFLMLIGLTASAKEEKVFVLPLFMTDGQNYNAYGFETASEIVADDIIQNFLVGDKVNSMRLEEAKALVSADSDLKLVREKYCKTGLIDFDKVAKVSKKSLLDKTLLVISYVKDKNNSKFEVWDVLKLASDFSIDYPYVLTTTVLLVDNQDGVALWQKSYDLNLASGKKPFNAKNFSQATMQYEKIRSYSKNVVSRDVEQNLVLRLNHKSIDFAPAAKGTSTSEEGIGLKYYKKKGIPVKITQPTETFEQRWQNDDSFSL